MIRAAFVVLAGLAACGPTEAEQAEACAQGAPQAEANAEQGDCKYVSNGRCFTDASVACLCEGCTAGNCAVDDIAPSVLHCD